MTVKLLALLVVLPSVVIDPSALRRSMLFAGVIETSDRFTFAVVARGPLTMSFARRLAMTMPATFDEPFPLSATARICDSATLTVAVPSLQFAGLAVSQIR